MPSLDTRLRQYAVLGAKGAVVPSIGFDATFPLGDTSVLGFSTSAAASGEIGNLAEVALEAMIGGVWTEVRSGRFLTIPTSREGLDPAKMRAYSGQNLVMWLLRSLQITPGASPLVDGARRFNSVTPGAIMKTILDEGISRGWGPGISYDFTATLDSAGVAWGSTLTLGYRPGQVSALQALQNLYDQGVVDFYTQGRTLRMFKAGTGVDRASGGSPVRLTKLSSIPIKTSIDSLVTDVTLYGEDGFTLAIHNPASITTLGRLEKAIAQGGVSDSGTATILAQRTLDQGSQLRREISAKTTAGPDSDALPWLHYQVGDWVQAKPETVWEPVRVYEIVVSKSETTTVAAVLNDRYVDMIERLAKRTTGILGGAVTGGSGGLPGEDNRKPKPPVGLIAGSTGYWAGADPSSQVALSWSPVTQGENSVAIDVSQYEVWGALGDAELNAVTIVETESATLSPYQPGSGWRFAVRAMSRNGVWGDLSSEVLVTMAEPTVAVSAPSAPILSSVNGLIEVQWDGALAAGGTPPASFMQLNVEASADSGSGFQTVSTIFRANERRLLQSLGGDTLYVRFVAVDALGRMSLPSVVQSVPVSPLIGDGTILARYLAPDVGEQLNLSANEAILLMVGQISGAQATADGALANVTDLRTYFSFEVDGFYISTPGSTSRLRLTNDRIEMIQSGQVVAYWTGGRMVVVSMIAQDLTLGYHKVTGDIVGHTTWRPV